MKISYRTHPILQKLDEKKLGVVGIYECDKSFSESPELIEYTKDCFKYIVDDASPNIAYLTNPFSNAINQSFKSLISDDVWNSVGDVAGCILNTPVTRNISTVFSIKGVFGEPDFFSYVFYFQGDVLVGQRSYTTKYKFNAWYSKKLLFWFRSLAKKLNLELSAKDIKNPVSNCTDFTIAEFSELDSLLYSELIATINFIKYARVETKFMPAGQKVKDIDCKYINETKSNIRILNSTWFTNLVKSDAFRVRGHFRLQPCGEGMKDRKLIWINEFQKEGYTAKARMLTAVES